MFAQILLLVLVAYASCECPSRWSQYKDSCYWASTSTADSWWSAQRSCKASGGYLTEIQDQDENDFISRLTFGEGNWFFMGIIHKEQCGGWVRVRDEKSIDYTNWLESEANKADKPKCTKLGYLGYWESFPCDEEQYFICESDKYISTRYFGGWITNTNSFMYEGHYYRTVGKMATFKKAKELCEAADAYLVEPDTEAENVYVHDKMHEAFYGKWRYIGGSDEETEGDWKWGENGGSVSFTNWWPGEPNNKYGEDCMEMRYWGKWNDVDCYNDNHYICERSVDNEIIDEAAETTTEGTHEETTSYYYQY